MLARLATALLALSVLFGSGVTGHRSYRCLMSGVVHADPCCQAAERKHDQDRASFESEDCCQLQISGSPAPPATTRDALAGEAVALALVGVLAASIEPSFGRTLEGLPPVGARAPPPDRSAPLYLHNQSFLI